MRIPVVLGGVPAAGDAVLVEGDALVPPGCHVIRLAPAGLPSHRVACACCAPRGAVAVAFSGAFRDRATGAAPFFPRVVVPGPDAALAAAIEAALAEDAFTAARYRKAN